MGKLWWVWGVLALGAIAAGALGTSITRLDAAPDKVGTALTALIFVALLIERVVEVFVSPLTAGNKQGLEDQRVAAQAKIAEFETLLKPAATVANPVPTPPDAALVADYAEQIKSLKLLDQALASEIKAKDKETQRLALSFSIPISVVVALAGVRAIGPLLATTCGPNWSDKVTPCDAPGVLMAMADVILTAGLLAGGADGIHKVLDNVISYASGNKAPKQN